MGRTRSYRLFRETKNKIVNISASLVLVATSIGGGLPLLFTGNAGAVADTTYGTVSLSSGWAVDRTTPSGGYGTGTAPDGSQALHIGIVPPSNATSTFYQFEGIKKNVSPSKTITAKLYIDDTWTSNVRAGLWGGGYDASSQLSSYPIIEYNKSAPTNWRIFDSADPGGWRDINVSSATNGWNTIELAISKTDPTKTDVYVNGTQVGQSVGDPTSTLNTIYLNSYNSGTSPYDVYWKDIQTGLYNPDVPQNLRFVHDSNSALVASGSTVNYTNITMLWNTVANAERYQIRVASPDGQSQQNRNTGWYTFDLDDQSRFGQFGTQQGTWSYSVRTKDATTGLWSNYSAPITLIFDSVAPTVTNFQQAYNSKGGGRIDVTLTFSEPLDPASMAQGWYEVPGTNGTQFTKAYYSTKSYTINFTDVAGNTGNYSFSVDMTKPTLSSVRFKDAGTNIVKAGKGVLLYFTASEPLHEFPTVTLGGKTVNVAYENQSTNTYRAYLYVDSSTPEGPLALSINYKDTTGNAGTTTTGTTDGSQVIIDRTGPTITAKSSSVGTASADTFSKVDFKLHDTYKVVGYSINAGSFHSLTPDIYSDANGITVNSNGARYGANTIYVKDAAGNIGTYNFVLDNVGPTVTIKASPDTVGTNPYSKMSFKLYDQYKIDKVTVNGVVKDLSNNNYSDLNNVKPGSFGAIEGTNTLVVYDVAGNTTPLTFTLDTTDPTGTLAYSPNTYTNHSVTVTLTTSEPIQQSVLPGTWLKVNDTEYKKVFPVNATQDVTLEDLAGNTGSVTVSINWIDKALPVVGITTASQTHKDVVAFKGYVNDANFKYYYCWLTVKGSSSEISNTRGTNCITTWAKDLQQNGNPATSTNEGDGTSVSPVQLGDFDITGLVSGNYTVHLIAVDRAGNQSTEATFDTVVDHTDPILSIVSSAGTDTTPTVTGTVDDSSAIVKVTVNGHVYAATVTGNTWSADVTDVLPVGSYDVVATATDAAGNTGTDSTTNELTITAPAVLGASTSNSNVTSTSSQNSSTENTNNSDNGSAPEVLGDSTTTPNTTDDSTGNVKGDSTSTESGSKDTKKAASNDNFLGLGWWWLLVLLALGFPLWILGKRRATKDA
ncbi:hypothetical protein BH09PAT4_BH09PAT4_07750 [soil metagenome]